MNESKTLLIFRSSFIVHRSSFIVSEVRVWKGLLWVGIVYPISKDGRAHRLEVGQHRPALLPVDQLKDVFKVLREVGEHVLGCLPRVVGSENEGRQLAALATKGLPQLGLAIRASLALAGWHRTLFGRFV